MLLLLLLILLWPTYAQWLPPPLPLCCTDASQQDGHGAPLRGRGHCCGKSLSTVPCRARRNGRGPRIAFTHSTPCSCFGFHALPPFVLRRSFPCCLERPLTAAVLLRPLLPSSSPLLLLRWSRLPLIPRLSSARPSWLGPKTPQPAAQRGR